MNAPDLAWFKSSYSSPQGDNCVEIAFSWRKSSYSGPDGDNCVEVAACPGSVHVRDSKDPVRGHVTVSPTAWTAFLTTRTP